MSWYKQADFMGQDPYKVNFESEEAKARNMDTDTLLGALSDAIEAAGVSANQGKYTDQASVYRKVLTERGMSTRDQDEAVMKIPSLHTNPAEGVNSEEEFAKKQLEGLTAEIKDYMYKAFSAEPSLSLGELGVKALDAFLDEEDFVNAPEYAEKVQSLIKAEIGIQEQAKQESEDWSAQAEQEAEMGRDTHMNYGDDYGVEDTSPCKDPNDRPRSNGKEKSYQKQPNLEQQNHFTASP